MVGLHLADIVAIGVYLLVVGGIGYWASRKLKKANDFIMPHSFGKLAMSMFAFGAGTHSDQAVSVASKSFTNGISGIWYQWFWLFATPFYWLIAPVMRRFRAVTTADIFEARFDRRIAMLCTLVGVLYVSVSIGVMLKGSGAIIEACTGGNFDSNIAIVAMTILFMFYGIAGGLAAAIYTDLIQGILTIIFSFIILPSIMNVVGGMDGLRAALSPEMLSLTMPGDISVFYVFVISVAGIIAIAVQPHILGVCSAGRTEMDGRVGFVSGNLLKRICTIAWSLTGVAAIVHYSSGTVDHPDKIYGMIAYEFLPQIMPGLIGVFIAALLASVMSSCDAFMISGSGLFTNNIYKNLLQGKSSEHYIKVLRISAFFVVLLGVLVAFTLPGVIKGLQILWKIPTIIGVSFWLGFFWKRFNSYGAWATTICASSTWLIMEQQWGINLIGRINTDFLTTSEESVAVSLPWKMLLFTTFGGITGIVVSLLTKPTDPGKLSNYYDLVHTPVTENEESQDLPCHLPEGVSAKPHLCFSLPFGIHVPIPNSLTVAGFVGTFIIVFGMIFFLYYILQP